MRLRALTDINGPSAGRFAVGTGEFFRNFLLPRWGPGRVKNAGAASSKIRLAQTYDRGSLLRLMSQPERSAAW